MLSALSGCYIPHGSFSPYSASVHTDPIAKEAIEMGPGDMRAVQKAGGVLIGSLECDVNNTFPYVEAAMNGGTHFIPARSSGSVTVFSVYRVPRGGWDALPSALRPVAN